MTKTTFEDATKSLYVTLVHWNSHFSLEYLESLSFEELKELYQERVEKDG